MVDLTGSVAGAVLPLSPVSSALIALLGPTLTGAVTPSGITLTADPGDDITWVCQLRQSLSESLLVGVTDITDSNWSAVIKCHLGASYSFLSDKAQYPKVLNRTHQLHVYPT